MKNRKWKSISNPFRANIQHDKPDEIPRVEFLKSLFLLTSNTYTCYLECLNKFLTWQSTEQKRDIWVNCPNAIPKRKRKTWQWFNFQWNQVPASMLDLPGTLHWWQQTRLLSAHYPVFCTRLDWIAGWERRNKNVAVFFVMNTDYKYPNIAPMSPSYHIMNINLEKTCKHELY